MHCGLVVTEASLNFLEYSLEQIKARPSEELDKPILKETP